MLKQQLLELDSKQLDERIKKELHDMSVHAAKERPYESVRLKKPCPNCNTDSLVRYVESVPKPEMPVMPLYICSNCKKKSYYLTTAYLEHLIKNNTDLFSKAELSEFDKNSDAFIRELEGYILRIFASKKIMCIK